MTKDLEYGLRPHNYDNISMGLAVTGFSRQPDAEWNGMYTHTHPSLVHLILLLAQVVSHWPKPP